MWSKKIHAGLYVSVDFISAALAWMLFFVHRKNIEMNDFSQVFETVWADSRLYQGLVVIPLCWIVLYSAYGYYRQIFNKTLFTDLVKTINHSIGGVVVLFFIVILDDYVVSYNMYYNYVFVLFLLHFSLTLMVRWGHTYWIRKRIQNRKIVFNTLMVGNGVCAEKIYTELQHQKRSDGYNILGYVPSKQTKSFEGLVCFGEIKQLETIVKSNQIEEVILALDDEDATLSNEILSALVSSYVSIRISPNLESFFHNKSTSFLHTTLLLLSNDPLPTWQNVLKRLFDVVFSALFGLLLSPFIVLIIWKIKRDSKGSVFYTQERVGWREKPFLMYKFRSMIQCAEQAEQPMLSSENDNRITPFGRFMRKYRIDELPQLWNVIKGDMSLVGPRPERQYYIDQITQIAPQYKLLLRVKPGLTSWGEVQYGYASSVSQMLDRMLFDLQYIDNMALSNDLKILFYTIITVLKGEGK